MDAAPDLATIQPDAPVAPPEGKPHRIVVVGGGAAGIELATRLGDTLGRRPGRAAITLIDRARTHLWKPLLHAIAAGSMDPGAHAVDHLAHAHKHNYRYRYGEMTGLDRAHRVVKLAAAMDEEGREITPANDVPYDTLVIAVGSVTNDFGTPGAAEHAVPLETPAQATRFNRRLVNACIRAHSQSEPVRPGQLHIAIIGAGATGTELAAELHRTARAVVAHGLDTIDPERDIRIVLIEAAPRILPALPERMANSVLSLLEKQGVEVRTGAKVAEVRANGVVLADGSVVTSELVVWAAGVKGPDVLANLDGLEVNKSNQLVVHADLSTTRDPDVFALGDCAAAPRPGSLLPVPPRAQAAHQMAAHLARELERRLDVAPMRPYRYRDFGSLVSLGRYSTVGNLMGFVSGKSMFIEGLFARMMYRSLYKMHEHALHGAGHVAVTTLARSLGRQGAPQVKLH